MDSKKKEEQPLMYIYELYMYVRKLLIDKMCNEIPKSRKRKGSTKKKLEFYKENLEAIKTKKR